MRTVFLSLLLVTTAVVAQETQAPEGAFKSLLAEYEAEMATYRAGFQALTQTEEYKAALAARDAEALQRLRSGLKAPDSAAWAKRFVDASAPYSGKEGAVPFLVWAAMYGGAEGSGPAVDRLIANHIGSPRLEEFSESLPGIVRAVGAEKGREIADTLIEKSPHAIVKAHAHYARAQMLAGRRGETPSAEDTALRDADLAAVVKLAPDSIPALRAQAPKFQAENLQIGKTVPDIEGVDLDGTAFKLSDYRGKVVVIDFWGDW